MKPHPVVFLAFFSAVLSTGCEHARQSRIHQHEDLYAALDPFDRKLVREGLFDLGFSTDMLYMSLGKPDKVTPRQSDVGAEEIWTYKNFLYESMHGGVVGMRDPTTVRGGRPMSARSLPQGMPNTLTGPPTPTIAEMAGPPHATLLLCLL
jgi:hypothetical protein